MLLVGCLIAALGLAALRVDIIRLRYGLATAIAEEDRLRDERSRFIAKVGQLRDPARLREFAARLDLAAPNRVIDLRSESTTQLAVVTEQPGRGR